MKYPRLVYIRFFVIFQMIFLDIEFLLSEIRMRKNFQIKKLKF